MVGEHFEISLSEIETNGLNLSTMVGEKFEIYSSQMAKNALKIGNSEQIIGTIIGIA